jgi:hypothetical protein
VVEELQQLLDECIVAAGGFGLLPLDLPGYITKLRTVVEVVRDAERVRFGEFDGPWINVKPIDKALSALNPKEPTP